MPLEVYERGNIWWAKGYVELNGQRISRYIRRSTGATSEAGARQWVALETERQIRVALFGEQAALTFADALMLYPAKPIDAQFLLKVLPEIGAIPIAAITPKMVKNLGPKLYPEAAADTWWRQVVTPVRAVINNAHEEGKGTPPIKIKAYTAQERIDQDNARQKQSRIAKKPFTLEWVEAFCAEADPHNAALVRLIFETGVRITQAVTLEANHCDLMNKRVWVKAQKGHPAQWVTISHEMMIELANLSPKKPVNRKTGEVLAAKVFGYATRSGYRKAWATICKKAGIEALKAHSGRHGYYTHGRVVLGLDAVTVAKGGRWSNSILPDTTYAHSDTDQAEIRAAFRTKPVQAKEHQANNHMKKNG